MRIESGSTTRYIYFVAVDSTDLKTRETGLTTFTVYRSRNGAAAAAMTTPTINEINATNMPGVYGLLVDEDTTIAAGNDTEEMVFHITQASMAPVTRTVELYRPKITAGNTLDVTATGAVTLAPSQGAITFGAITISVTGATNNITLDGAGSGDGLVFTRSGSGELYGTNWSLALQAEANAACDAALADYDAATGAELAAVDTKIDTIDTNVDSVKAKTDQMVFTKANELDVNTKSINDAEVVGNGNSVPWDGA